MSARQLQRHLGIGGYKTAWHLCHRIRKAIQTSGSPMGGILEIDETYVGGKKPGKGVYAGKKSKSAVMGIIQRGGNLRLKSVEAPTFKGPVAKQFIKDHVSPDAELVCRMSKHLHRYLSEFEYRFNGRHDNEPFSKTAAAISRGAALPFAELIAD